MDLIIYQVSQFKHINVAYRDLVIKRLSGPAVIKSHFTGFGCSGLAQSLKYILF
jgi:hypothetical protein